MKNSQASIEYGDPSSDEIQSKSTKNRIISGHANMGDQFGHYEKNKYQRILQRSQIVDSMTLSHRL